ncbi:MAG: SusC/RagA family TonB-linked outer membrane protein [Gemmatimonadota bacterium]
MTARAGLLSTVLLLLTASLGIAQQRTISGRVIDMDTQAPVANASVSVVGTQLGAFGAEDGTFVLRGAPAGSVTLRVVRIGYRAGEVTVAADQSSVTVELRTDLLQLEQLVVTGRATALERRSVANAISTVSAAELERVPASSVEQAVQGKIAGADIQKNSGAPGGGIQVNLRGISSINAASEPLYVVDGTIVSNVAIVNNQDVVTQSSGGSNPSPLQQDQVNRIADLNPNDIESIEILKGASASAIYGSKASNGVVIITTKRGRPGPPRVDLTQRFGFFELSEKFNYRTFRGATEDEVVSVFGEAAREPFRQGRFFDHEQELSDRNKLSFETIASVSGGSENTSYFVSALVKDDEGIVNNTGYQKQSLRLNIDQQLGERWRLGVSSNIVHTLARRGLFNNDNFLITPFFALPFIPRFFDLRQRPDGTFPDNPFTGGSNPLQTFELMKNEEEVWRFIGSADLSWEAVRTENSSLRLIARGGIDWFRQENDLFFPPELFFEPDDGLPGTSLLSDSDNRNQNLSGDAVYSYTPSSGSFRATTSAGVQFEERELNIARIVSRDLTAGQENLASGTQIEVSQRKERVEDFGFYIQEELQLLDERLTLTGAVRGEQSSANGDDEEVFWYPKGSAAYSFTGLSGAIEDLKLRVAYGESGNQPLFGQKFISLNATQNIEGEAGIVVNPRVGDPNIEPERTREIEAGFDATLVGGNASLEFTFYQQNITDLLLQQTVAPSSGFESRFVNGGELRVRGVELALGLTPFRTSDFQWVSRTLFSLDRSKVLELEEAIGVRQFSPAPGDPNSGFGPSLGEFRVEEGASATQIVGIIPSGDIVKIGDTNPDFKMSFVNEFSYKGLSLYTLFDWRRGGDIINLNTLISDLAQTTEDFLENGAARLGAFGTDARAFLESGTFVKLREATLAYELPTDVVKKLWSSFRRVRLSLSARDLFVFTGYSGLDPEVSNFGNQSIGRNIDTSPYPPSRSFWFSIDLGF